MNPLSAVPWYLSAGLAIALTAVSVFAWFEHERAGISADKLGVCEQKISGQNDAVKNTAADGARRVANAAKGVESAAAATKSVLAEAERQRQLAAGATPDTAAAKACPAGAAVAELRKGLKP
jgi:hypothetical protein